ncbi:MAG: AsmA family protein [Magnetococcales bacterium]|nr:AsmA family protein [Magnetococcales bacterium]NGZ06198.1 AsmA family protein [Magnetococcales bacterium]
MKKLFLFLLLPVMAIVAAIAAIPLFVDPNQHKEKIAALVKERTGRDLTVNGAIELSLFPWAGLTLGEVTFGDGPGFGPEPFAKVARLEVRAKLVPLMSKQLEADKIVIQGLELKLARDAKGKGNWEGLNRTQGQDPSTGTTANPQTTVDTKSTSSKMAGLESITLGGVEIRDAQITWNNAVNGAKYLFKGLKLTSGVIVPGQPVTFELESQVERIQSGMQGRLQLAATLIPPGTDPIIKLQKTKLGMTLQGGKDALVNQAELHLTSAIEAALDGSQIKLSGLDATLKSEGGTMALARAENRWQGSIALTPTRLSVTGLTWTVKGEGKPDGGFRHLEARYQGDLDGERKNLLLKLPGMNLTAKVDGMDLHLTATGELDGVKQSLRLSQVKLEGLEQQLKGEGHLTLAKGNTQPTISGEWTLQPVNPRTLLAKLNQKLPVTADDKAWTALHFKGAFTADAKRIDLSRMEAKLDDTSVRGALSWPYDGVTTTRFDLEGDTLDLDRYLSPDSKAAPVTTQAPATDSQPTPVKEADAIPVAALKRLDLDGRLKLSSLKVQGGRFQDLQLSVKSKDGVVRLEPATWKLYGGSTRLEATLDVRGVTPKLAWKQQLQAVQLAPLLKELAKEESLSGTANLSLDVTATGNHSQALKQAMNGTVSFAIQDGVYLKKDLTHAIRQAYGTYAAAKGRPMDVGQDTGRTPFKTLEGSAEIRQGILETKNLQALTSAFKMTGAGTIDLPGNQINLLNRVNVTALDDQNTRSLNDLKGVTIPVRIQGDLSAPQTQIDLAGLMEEALKTKAMEKVQEKLGGKIQEKLGNKLQEKLGGDLNRLLAPGR